MRWSLPNALDFHPNLDSVLTHGLVMDCYKHFVWFQEIACARGGD
jgi:hypothetical protein